MRFIISALLLIALAMQGCERHSPTTPANVTTTPPASQSIPFIYALDGVDADFLVASNALMMVIDPEFSGLTGHLQKMPDSMVFAYLSIGEAEDYRDYWNEIQSWHILLKKNKDFPDNFRIKFWDPRWQQLIKERLTRLVQQGYDGAYLDVIDAYQVKAVKKAYNGSLSTRQEMEKFVIELSQHAKSINPDFKIIPQNAEELMARDISANPMIPNTAYLNAIDGLGKEDLFYDDDHVNPDTRYDLELVRIARDAGKFILATSYPTTPQRQMDFVRKAAAEGFWPFVSNRDLNRGFVSIEANYSSWALCNKPGRRPCTKP